PLLDLREVSLLLGDAVLHSARLGDEPVPGLRVLLLPDAPGHLVLALSELVKLLDQSRAPVGQLDDKPYVSLDAAVPGVLLHSFGVLADVFEVQHWQLLVIVGFMSQISGS